jgi:carbonic anhydrase
MRFAVLGVLFLGLTSAAGAQSSPSQAGPSSSSAASSHVAWSYVGKNGPVNWAKLDPAFRACSSGHEQSPIDIRGAHLNKTLEPLNVHYLAGPVTLENTGNAIVVHVDPGSWMESGGVRYALEELVFHHPSEEAVHGKLDDMDVELIHLSADGKRAIVSIRLREDAGQANATLSTLWQHLPARAGTSERVTGFINPGGLLPADRGYWTYMGSLPTPPCTEGVRWFVLEQDLSISREQLRQFAGMFRFNARSLQDGHGRKIEANE